MTRDGLPRAYLRIDPNIDQAYPQLRSSIIGLMCAAHRQPERGRFRDWGLVESLCGRAYVRRAADRGDLVELEDGRVYLDGWDEWQEGDLTVAERMRRMRDRRRRKRNSVTDASSPDRGGVTTDAFAKEVDGLSGVGVGEAPKPPPSGGHGLRANGTNKRAIAAELTRQAEEAAKQRKARRIARQRAYLDGRLTESQRDDMNELDAPLEDIPTQRGAAYQGASA